MTITRKIKRNFHLRVKLLNVNYSAIQKILKEGKTLLINLLITASSLNLTLNVRNKNLCGEIDSVAYIQPKSSYNPLKIFYFYLVSWIKQ